MPGGLGDPLQAVGSLPGVGRASFDGGKLLLWGAAPEDSRVYVDGAYLQTIDLSALSTSPRRIVFSRIWSSPGTHRLTIRVAGGGPVSIDLFVVLR